MYTIFYIFFEMINLRILYMTNNLFIKEDFIYNKKLEICLFILYYVFNVIMHIYFKSPIISISFNLIFLFIITLAYKININQKILLTLTILTIFLSTEILISLLTQRFEINIFRSDYNQSLGLCIMTITYYLIFKFLQRFEEVIINLKLDLKTYFYIMIIPFISVIFLVYSLSISDVPKLFYIISILFILSINIFIFYFYSILIKYINTYNENKFLNEKEKVYNNQINIMSKSLNIIKEVKHDFKNHLICIRNLIGNNELEESKKYIDDKFKLIFDDEIYINTNNIAIDSILNFKFHEAKKYNIDTKYDIFIPSVLNIKSFDLITILGNLLDNAIEGNLKVNEDRFIDIKIKYDRGRLFITVQNRFDGVLKWEESKLTTTKKKTEFNNLGLNNVKRSLEKYNGTYEISINNNIFSNYLIIFLK